MTAEPKEHFDANFNKIGGFFKFWTIFLNLIENRGNLKIEKMTENSYIYGLTMENKQKSADLNNV